MIERSPLARLRADEQNLERRRQNVTNFGSAWLKPPGVPKTLHQLREERREAEEHQEALRREHLAQELAEAAEAEAAGAAAAAATAGDGGDPDAMLDALPDGDDGMDDVQLDGARDLDDDIPEADEADFGLSGNEDEDEDEDDEDEDDEEDEDEDENAEEREVRAAQAQEQQLVAQRMRQANDAFREDMARGRESASFYGVDEDVDEEDQSQMIEEDDLVGAQDDLGMDADLDDEIPEAESLGGYEHTDTEADMSSILDVEGDNHDTSRISITASQQSNRFRHRQRHSLAISDVLSRDGSSVLGSSPAVPRQRAGLSSRRGRN